MSGPSVIGTKERSSNLYTTRNEPSKETIETIGIATIIILSLGGLAVAGVGLGGFGMQQEWWQAGALSNLSQINSIIMMAAGGGGGIILLITGIVDLVKNHRNNTNDSTQSISTSALSTKAKDFDTQGNTVYGPKAYERFKGVKVVGEERPIPEHLKAREGERDPFFGKPIEKSFPLLYIPKQISVNGEVMDLTFNNLEKMTGIPFKFCSPAVKENFGNTPLESGWRRMSMGVISKESKSYQEQKDMVENTEKVGEEIKYRMPQALEAAIFMYMVHAFTDKWVYPEGTFTRCMEKIDDLYQYPILIGWGVEDKKGSSSSGFDVSSGHFVLDNHGVGAVRN